MSLPVVTYGNYNYGDYANPRAVQYQGGFGEGLTKAAVSVIESYKEKKAEVKKANEDAYLASAQFNSEMEKLFGKAASANRVFLQDLKQDYGNTVKAYKLGNITLEQYSDRMDYFNGVVNDATLLADVMAPVIQSENDISFDDVRDNPDNRASNLMRNAVRNGRYVLGRDEKGLKIMLPVGDPSNFAVKFVDAKELINNPKYINPDLKYKHIDNDKFSTFLDDFANNSANKGILKKKQDAEIGEEYVVFDDSAEGIEKMKNLMLDQNANPLFSNVLDADEKEKYWEDVMGKDNWTGDEAQRNELNEYLANEAATILSKRGPIRSYRIAEGGPGGTSRNRDFNTAKSAFDSAVMNPVNFYNVHVTRSPYSDTTEGATYLGQGKYEIKTDVIDSKTGQLVPGPSKTIDLTNYQQFSQYAGTVIARHRSLQGTAGGTKEAIASVEQEEYIKQKYQEYMDNLALLDENLPEEAKNQRIVNESLEKENLMKKAKSDPDYELASTGIITHNGDKYTIFDDPDKMLAENYAGYFIQQSTGKLKMIPLMKNNKDYARDKQLMQELIQKKKEAEKRFKAKYPTINL